MTVALPIVPNKSPTAFQLTSQLPSQLPTLTPHRSTRAYSSKTSILNPSLPFNSSSLLLHSASQLLSFKSFFHSLYPLRRTHQGRLFKSHVEVE